MRSFSLKSSYFFTSMIVEGGATPVAEPVAATPDTAPDTAPGQALTGDAGGPVAAAGALPPGALSPAAVPEPSATPATTTTKKSKTKTTTVKTNPNTTVVAVAVAVGASPVVTVVGGADIGSPTTVKPLAKKKTTKKR